MVCQQPGNILDRVKHIHYAGDRVILRFSKLSKLVAPEWGTATGGERLSIQHLPLVRTRSGRTFVDFV